MINIFPTGLACEDDSDAKNNKESKSVSCIDEKKRSEAEEGIGTTSGVMDYFQEKNDGVGVEVEADFEIWPVEHPMEPPDEDRPVKCPMPESSVINDEGMKREKRVAESLRKRADQESSAANKQGEEDSGAVVERPVRAVRKRHHTLTGGDDDHVIGPLTRMPPLTTHKNPTIFQTLHQFDKFES